MGDWLDLHAVCVNEWMSRKCLENGLGYNVYVHYNFNVDRIYDAGSGSIYTIVLESHYCESHLI